MLIPNFPTLNIYRKITSYGILYFIINSKDSSSVNYPTYLPILIPSFMIKIELLFSLILNEFANVN